MVWQADVFKKAKGLQLGSTRELQGGYHFTLYKVTPGEAVKFGPLGYAAAAIQSYGDFKWARSDGKIPAGTRFQVSLPTPIAVVMTFTDPQSIQQVWPIYEEHLNEEVAEIAAAIHDGPSFSSQSTSLIERPSANEQIVKPVLKWIVGIAAV